MLLALLAVNLIGAPGPVPAPVQDAIRQFLKENRTPGLSVAAVGPQGVLWSGGFGVANIETQRPATAATRYQFASVTKVYTALVLAQLAVEGKVDLDAPLTRYLPELAPHYAAPGCRPPTVRDLASHTAGFTRDMVGPKVSGRSHAYTPEELFAWLRADGLTVPPGLQYKYSNFGFALLGAVVERAGGMPYRDLLRERVLRPLGLHASGFAELKGSPEAACPYYEEDGALKSYADTLWDFKAQAAASELVSTVEDVARFAHAHLGGGREPVVTPRIQSILFTPHFPTGAAGAIGLGWHYNWDEGMPRWSHGGLVNHFQSLVVVRPDVGLGVVLAANGPGPIGQLVLPILKQIAPQADTAGLDRLVGDYVAPGGMVAMVRRTPLAELTLEVHGAVRLVCISPDTYRVLEGSNAGEWVRFVREGGEMVMVWESRKLVRRPAGAGR